MHEIYKASNRKIRGMKDRLSNYILINANKHIVSFSNEKITRHEFEKLPCIFGVHYVIYKYFFSFSFIK
jgi:hypothetical protein